MQDADIIEALGGSAEISRQTGIPLTTIHSWKRSNRIPEWRRPVLIDLAAVKGVDLAIPPTPESAAA